MGPGAGHQSVEWCPQFRISSYELKRPEKHGHQQLYGTAEKHHTMGGRGECVPDGLPGDLWFFFYLHYLDVVVSFNGC